MSTSPEMAERKKSLKIREGVHMVLKMASAKAKMTVQAFNEMAILRQSARYVSPDDIRRVKEVA